MTGMTPTTISTSLGNSPMPNQTMNRGMKASGGSGRVSSMTGSMRWRSVRLANMTAPIDTPMATPTTNPIRIRRRLMSRSAHSGWLCDG